MEKKTKICSNCKIEQELCEFCKDKSKKDGLRSNCKICRNKDRRIKLTGKKVIICDGEKECNRCFKIKKLIDFVVSYENKSGVRAYCKECENERLTKKRLINNPKICEYIPKGKKKCGKCKEIKEFSNFGKASERKDKLKPYCRPCASKQSNGEKHKKRKQKWYLNNRELTIKRAIDRNINNKEERKIYILNWTNEFNEKNPHIVAWRAILRNTLERMNKKKENHTIDLLGYSALDLKNHITLLFTDGMTWDNWGEWHVDHIKMVCDFDKETPMNIVNALSNLRPLWATSRVINGIFYEGNLNRKRI